MEKRFEKIYILLKDWYNLGLIKQDPRAWELSINKFGYEWCVEIPKLGATEYGYSLEETLDLHIEALENDEDYIKECHLQKEAM
ncbi:MAG: hypothetical protein ACRC0F_01525 [Cetobacterium sp.]